MHDRTTEMLMGALVDDLKPVRRLGSPWRRTLFWLALVLAAAAFFALDTDLSSLRDRLSATPSLWLAVLGAALTAVLAAIASFQLALPDRGRLWALLPAPALALWLGASGLGCARSWLMPGTQEISVSGSAQCVVFILGVSVPLSVAMIVMLRRGYSMQPSLTSATGGLAVAAAAATLLNFFHPFDAAVSDLVVHSVIVALVILLNRACGCVLLRRRSIAVQPSPT